MRISDWSSDVCSSDLNVTIYQCVTLGGTSPDNGVAGKRHPTILDGAIIGSGAQVLGPVVIGARARIGANAVVTKGVVAGAVGSGERRVGEECVSTGRSWWSP